MKSRISHYIVASLFILGMVPLSVYGQGELDTLNIKVVGAYNPTIADAYKISDFPRIDDKAPPKPELKYGINSDKFTSDFKVVPVKPATIKGEHLTKLYKGYIKIAGGSPGIFQANGFYNSLRSKRKAWGVKVNHFSSSGKVDDVGYSGFGESGINLYGKKFLKKHTLSGGLDMDMNNYHFYGYDMTDSVVVALDDTITGRDATLQKFTILGAHARLLSHYRDSTALNYDIRFKYYNLTDNYQTMENNFVASVDFTRYIEKEFMDIYFEYDYNDDRFYKDADSMRILSNTVVTLRPQITTGGPKYKFTVGLNGVLDVLGDLYVNARIYPNLYFSYNLVKDIMIPYVGIGGGLKRNTIRTMSTENPYINSDLHDDFNNTSINNTVNSIQFYGGIKGEFSSSSSFNISISRDKLDNQYFYVNDTSSTLNNRFGLIYDNVAQFRLKGEMSYQVREKIKLMLVGEINEYKMDLLEQAYHKPAYHISLLGSYNLQEKIIVKTDLFAIGDQYARTYDDQGSPVPVKLKGVFDANLELEYRYTKKLSVYLKLNNLTAQRYNRWYAYPTMRFNFLVGLTYIF